jgi:hypothetical protein
MNIRPLKVIIDLLYRQLNALSYNHRGKVNKIKLLIIVNGQ